jgi:PAS domain S-box-containing protein
VTRVRRPRSIVGDVRQARIEAYRLAAGAPPEPAFEELMRRACEATGVATACLVLEDDAGEHVVARHGPDRRTRVVATVPVVTPDDLLVGHLVLSDRVPRDLSTHARRAVENLAQLAMARLEARRDDLPQATRRADTGSSPLALEKDFSAAVIESFPGAFWLVSSDGVIVRWNRQLAAASGYSDAEIGSMHPLDFISGRDRPAMEAALRRVLEGGDEVSLEAELVDRAGNVRPYAITGKPVRLGGRMYMIGLAADITMKRRTEQQMARAKERLDLALSSSSLALWDWDLRLNRVYFNENWRLIRGQSPEESTFSSEEVLAWNHPDDQTVYRAALGNAVKGVSEEFDCEYRVANAWASGCGSIRAAR